MRVKHMKENINPNNELPCWNLTQRQLCDLELILNKGFAPLSGYMKQMDYESVLTDMRLANGAIWPLPIMLDVDIKFADNLSNGDKIALRDPEGVTLAILQINSIWQPDKTKEAVLVYGTEDVAHPGVNYLFNKTNEVYIGGELQGLALPTYYDFRHIRKTPAQLTAILKQLGWQKIVGFQTRNPMHRAHVELTLRAAREHDANLLISPTVGMTKPGDVDYFTRVHCYEKIMGYYPADRAYLNLLPVAMRMAGPREAVWHAIIRKNYGCTHFIVGRDHAGPGKNAQGVNFYEPYAAQQLAINYEKQLGIKIVPFQEMVYLKNKQQYFPINEINKDDEPLNISGTELRRRLQNGLEIPEWFTYPAVIAELRQAYPPKIEQGFTVFFTGLSGAGKSTLAHALMVSLMEKTKRKVTLLDGDIVRKRLSSELGFSKEHRNLNILRIGYVASEITKHKGIAICAPIAPYQATRQAVREMVAESGNFLEVYVSTPLEVCEQRDSKGLYAKARAGLLPEFTGINDPYEIPEKPEITIDTAIMSCEEGVQLIVNKLIELGLIEQHSETK